MKFKERINILFKPFLISFLLLLGGYTFLHWLLLIKLHLFQVKDIVIDVGLPIALTGIFAWLILRPRFKVLKLDRKNGNLRDLYSIILWAILTVPLIIAQEYLITATGKLNKLGSVKEISKSEHTKYYSLERYYINKRSMGVHSEFEVTGKNSEDFNMRIYVVLPVFENAEDTIKADPGAWLGITYQKKISNSLESEEKEARYREFAEESQKDFDKKNVSEFVYLDRLSHSDKRDGYLEVIKKNQAYKVNDIVFEPVNEPFEARNGNKLAWLVGSSLVGSLIWLIMILMPKLDEQRLVRIQSGKPDQEAKEELNEFVEFLKPKDGFFITPILMYANVGMYVLMAATGYGFLSFRGEDLLQWGANYGPYTKGGEWWRLLTNTFLHGGLMHLLANMYGLLFVGVFLEPILGRGKYLAAYLLTGIIASASSIWWYDATVSVGASGAIFGLYGVFIALILTKVYPRDFAKSFLVSTAVFVGFNLIMGLRGGIDNAAHIGGLLSGFVVGLILYMFVFKGLIENDPGDPII